MELFNLLLDLVLVGISLWVISVVRGLGGILGVAFSLIAWAAILLGIAHILETILFEVTPWAADVLEFIHRVVVLGGMTFLAFGFKKIAGINK